MKANQITEGSTLTVLNKFNDEISEGRVVEVMRDAFTIESGPYRDVFMFRHVENFDGKTVKVTVSGAWL